MCAAQRRNVPLAQRGGLLDVVPTAQRDRVPTAQHHSVLAALRDGVPAAQRHYVPAAQRGSVPEACSIVPAPAPPSDAEVLEALLVHTNWR